MFADDTALTRLTSNSFNDDHPRWSPDGTKILFQSDHDNLETRNGLNYQIYVMNANGTNQVILSNSVAADNQPSFPNGTKIVFASDRDHAGPSDIYVMNANGSNLVRLTVASAPFRNEQPAWSRDATRLAFVSTCDSVIETWQETGDEGEILFKSSLRSNKEIYAMITDGWRDVCNSLSIVGSR
ncbi:MAG TPA: hypothetical protein VNO50_09410 [Pyrinomonadaceae bacterium]|nr:hypothetical protein [Pyrinomonadaceae bacterium]